MNFFNEWRSGKWISNTIALMSAILFYFILKNLSVVGVFVGSVWGLASPLVYGGIIAYLLDPLVLFFEKKGLGRKLAVVVTIVVLLAASLILVLALVPQLIAGGLQFLENLGGYIATLERKVVEIEGDMGATAINSNSISDAVVGALDTIAKMVDGQSLISTSSNIGSSLTTFSVSFILAVYYLSDKERLVTWFKRLFYTILKEERYHHFASFCARCHNILLNYIIYSLLEAVIVGVANLLFMTITGMPYAALISLIVGLTNLAPTFGPIVGCLLGMFVLLLVKPEAVLLFLLFTLVLQTIDGYVIKPKLFANTLGVSSLLILIFLILGGRIFGVVGILLAIPASAIIQYVVTEILFAGEGDKAESGKNSGEENSGEKYPAAGDSGERTVGTKTASLKEEKVLGKITMEPFSMQRLTGLVRTIKPRSKSKEKDIDIDKDIDDVGEKDRDND